MTKDERIANCRRAANSIKRSKRRPVYQGELFARLGWGCRNHNIGKIPKKSEADNNEGALAAIRRQAYLDMKENVFAEELKVRFLHGVEGTGKRGHFDIEVAA